MSIHNILSKYKKVYFLSYNFIISYNVVIVETEYVLHLMYKTITATDYEHELLKIPLMTNLEEAIPSLLSTVYSDYTKKEPVSRQQDSEIKIVHGILKCKASCIKKTVRFDMSHIRENGETE